MPRYLKRFTIAGLACLPLAYIYVVRMQALGRFDTEGDLYTAYCSVVLAALGGAIIAAMVSIGLRLLSRGQTNRPHND